MHLPSCILHMTALLCHGSLLCAVCLLFPRWFNGLFIASALLTGVLYYAHYKAGSAEQMESLLPTTHKTAASKA
jgi:hypothetical protein